MLFVGKTILLIPYNYIIRYLQYDVYNTLFMPNVMSCKPDIKERAPYALVY